MNVVARVSETNTTVIRFVDVLTAESIRHPGVGVVSTTVSCPPEVSRITVPEPGTTKRYMLDDVALLLGGLVVVVGADVVVVGGRVVVVVVVVGLVVVVVATDVVVVDAAGAFDAVSGALSVGAAESVGGVVGGARVAMSGIFGSTAVELATCFGFIA